MSLELPGAKLLPSATYSGNGDYNLGGVGPGSANLYYPSSGNVVISPDLEVEGDMIVDGGLYGPGDTQAVRMPAGAVGAGGNTILSIPQGIRMSASGSFPSDITATQTGGGAFLVNFQHGVRVTQGAFLNDVTQVGTTIGSGIVSIPGQDGMGSLGAPIIVPGPFTPPTANIQRYTLNGNKGFFAIPPATGFGNGTILVVSPDPRMNGQGVGRILPQMDPPLGTAGLSLTLGGGYGGPSDFVFINSAFGGGGGITWIVGVEYM